MNYATVCSGAEAFGPAWHELGFHPVFHAEIEAHASAVLRYQYPTVPNYGDFTQIATNGHSVGNVQLLCGGTPCQTFSIAGLRAGLDSYKGGLTLEFIRLAQRLGVQWLLWENVVGVLSADEGEAFGSFLGALAECGYGFAYRVLDAQYHGVPQRRRRVFVCGYLGDWRPAAAVLFESESLSGDFDSLEAPAARAGRVFPTVTRCGPGSLREEESYVIEYNERVRRLTVLETERLMGWPDGWTAKGINASGVPYQLPNSARYEICGNGWARPVATWVAGRIKMVESLITA